MASKTIDALTAGSVATAALIPVKQAAAEAVKISMTAAGATIIEAANAAAQRTALGLATIASSGSAADLSTGIIPDARMPNLTGDVTTVEGAVATTIANDAVTTAKILNSNVTLAKIANIADQRILGNRSGGAAAPEELTYAQVKTALSLPTSGNVYMIPFAFGDTQSVANDTWDLVSKVPTAFAGTITSITGLATVSGTVTLAVKINTTAVTSLSAISVTATPQDVTATGANTVAAGDVIRITTSSGSSPLGLKFVLLCTRS